MIHSALGVPQADYIAAVYPRRRRRAVNGGHGPSAHSISRDPGLAPQTLANYARPGYSDLIRGTDFVVRRITRGPYLRRKLFFTDRGLARLTLKHYRVFRPGEPSPAQKAFWGRVASTPYLATKEGGRPLETYSNQERRMRLKHQIGIAFQRYLELGGCAVPNCPCMIHSVLNVPQADYIAAIMPARKPRKR